MNQIAVARRLCLIAATLTAAVTLSACGSSSTGTASTATGASSGAMANMPGMKTSNQNTSNQADVAFVQMMIPDHKMIVAMSKLAEKKATSADLKALATQMQKGQSGTVGMMKGMLKEWGTTAADPAKAGMPGAMTAKDMSMLTSMTGPDFDTMFAQMMIKHHTASIQMALDEKAKGADAHTKTMAAEMVTAQQAQLKKLRKIAQL